jgi:predicted secreted protein
MITSLLKKGGIIFLILIAVACNVKKGNSSGQSAVMKDTVSFLGCQDQIRLKAGSIAEIKLEAIEGTGYQWLVKEPSPLLKQLHADMLMYSSSENKEGMTGKAGYQILLFMAVEAGEGVIRLEYKRTFEPGVDKSCSIKFTVEK